jgi:hypothetical protein
MSSFHNHAPWRGLVHRLCRPGPPIRPILSGAIGFAVCHWTFIRYHRTTAEPENRLVAGELLEESDEDAEVREGNLLFS